jgi:hypothetical protein
MAWGSRRLVAAVASVSLLFGAPACGSDDKRSGGDAADDEAPASDSDYRPLTKENFAAAVTKAMYSQGTVHIDFFVGRPLSSIDYRFGGPRGKAMKGTVTDDSGSVMEVVVVDGAAYAREEGERDYHRLAPDQAEPMLAALDTGSPTEIAETFDKGLGSVEYAGRDAVDGVQLRNYVLTMRREFVAEERGIDISEVPHVEYELWLDDEHLMHQLDIEVEGTAASVRMTDWGEPVRIKAPPTAG